MSDAPGGHDRACLQGAIKIGLKLRAASGPAIAYESTMFELHLGELCIKYGPRW